MREICLMGIGDSVKKLSYRLNMDINGNMQEDLVLGYRYVVLKEGGEDIQIVKNYNPYLISNNINENTLIEKGYSIVGVCGEKIIYCQSSGIRYSVKPLDTIEDISSKFGVSVGDIMLANKLNTSKLFVGQVLYI